VNQPFETRCKSFPLNSCVVVCLKFRACSLHRAIEQLCSHRKGVTRHLLFDLLLLFILSWIEWSRSKINWKQKVFCVRRFEFWNLNSRVGSFKFLVDFPETLFAKIFFDLKKRSKCKCKWFGNFVRVAMGGVSRKRYAFFIAPIPKFPEDFNETINHWFWEKSTSRALSIWIG